MLKKKVTLDHFVAKEVRECFKIIKKGVYQRANLKEVLMAKARTVLATK